MNKYVKTKELFNCTTPYLEDFFREYEYPWEILPEIKNYIKKIMDKYKRSFKEISSGVFVGENVKIYPNVVIEGPTIIGEGTEIRPGAFLRGNVIVGRNCVIGNSTEMKNSVLLDNVQIPHYNYVGDSVLGNYAHMGAGAICSNLKADGKEVIIHGNENLKTGLRKIGGILGDYADIGCGCVLNPGTVIGKGTRVYPLTSVRGVISEKCIVKSMKNIVTIEDR